MDVKYTTREIHLYDDSYNESITPISESNKLNTVLTVAGSDSSGGAGIEADIKTISAHKCYALTTIVSLTAQNTMGVINAAPTTKEMIKNMLSENFTDISICAIKTGLLTEDAIVELKNAILQFEYKGYLVADPVMVSTSGFDFINNSVLKLLIETLSPFITLLTPNMVEAKCLLNTLYDQKLYDKSNDIDKIEEIYDMCLKIYARTGISNILIKGGHQNWKDSNLLTDVLYCSDSNSFTVFKSEMINSKNTHGTGCTLSSAIASNLSNGLSIINSVANGIVYVQNGIKTAPNIGNGHGPLNHIQNMKQYNYMSSSKFELPFKTGEALEYLVNHPEVKDHWNSYTNHNFMKMVYNFKLPLDNFKRFAEQNYIYLQRYANVILKLASKSHNIIEMEDSVKILNDTFVEIKRHKNILSQLGFTDEYIENIKPSKECTLYTNELMNLAENSGDMFDIIVSLTPCFHGFREASLNAMRENSRGSNVDKFTREVYVKWIDQNTSEWYDNACINDKERLDLFFRKYCSDKIKLDRTIFIFKKFTKLEIDFLNSFL